MNKIKAFIQKNWKIVIPILVVIIVLIGVGVYLILRLNHGAENQADTQTAQESMVSKEEANVENQEEESEKENSESQQQVGQADGDTPEADTASGTNTSSQSANKNSNSYESSSPNSGTPNASHTHVWKEHTAKKWVSDIVTVVDEPEQVVKYSIYRMYWYTTDEWEETRDPDRFDVWYKSQEGGLYPLYHPYKKPEDNPLFLGYDKNGNPTYRGDHAIIGPYYETIPAVTHEEDHGHYETYVDYYYCSCGAKKK